MCNVCLVQGCTVMPSDAINPETPAKQGSVVEIQCQTDTEYDSCIFTHTNPFYVGQNIQQDTIVSMQIYLLSVIYFLFTPVPRAPTASP